MQIVQFARRWPNVNVVDPNRPANIVAAAIKIDPLLQSQIRWTGRLRNRNQFFWIARSRWLARVFRNRPNPFVQMRKEAAEELAQRAAHGKEVDGDCVRLRSGEREVRQIRFALAAEKPKQIGGDE